MNKQQNNTPEKNEHEELFEEEQQEHVPEWVSVFEELKKEADQEFPDGRVKVIVPRRRKNPPGQ